MKVNEVRLGNLVNGVDERFPIHRVSSVKGNSIETQPFSSVSWTSISEVSEVDGHLPIIPFRISQDWMVRLGFKVEAENDGDKIYMHPEAKGELRFVTNDANTAVKFANQELVKVKYVHQLQNLFFCLTGQELALSTK